MIMTGTSLATVYLTLTNSMTVQTCTVSGANLIFNTKGIFTMQNRVLSLTLKYLNYHTAMCLYHRKFRNRDCDKQLAEYHLHEELVEEEICSMLKSLLFASDV